MGKPKLGYWHLRGMGQPIRFLLAYLGVDYEEKRYTSFEEWFEKDKPSIELDFPNIPYWIDANVKLTETQAIVKYIATTHGDGLVPTDTIEKARADMLTSVIWDAWWQLIRLCNDYKEEARPDFDQRVPPKLEYLNKFIGNNPFVLGAKISYVDFILYEALYHFSRFEDDYLKSFPALESYKARFEQLPAIKAYIASDKYIIKPCINPMAKYAKINE